MDGAGGPPAPAAPGFRARVVLSLFVTLLVLGMVVASWVVDRQLQGPIRAWAQTVAENLASRAVAVAVRDRVAPSLAGTPLSQPLYDGSGRLQGITYATGAITRIASVAALHIHDQLEAAAAAQLPVPLGQILGLDFPIGTWPPGRWPSRSGIGSPLPSPGRPSANPSTTAADACKGSPTPPAPSPASLPWPRSTSTTSWRRRPPPSCPCPWVRSSAWTFRSEPGLPGGGRRGPGSGRPFPRRDAPQPTPLRRQRTPARDHLRHRRHHPHRFRGRAPHPRPVGGGGRRPAARAPGSDPRPGLSGRGGTPGGRPGGARRLSGGDAPGHLPGRGDQPDPPPDPPGGDGPRPGGHPLLRAPGDGGQPGPAGGAAGGGPGPLRLYGLVGRSPNPASGGLALGPPARPLRGRGPSG